MPADDGKEVFEIVNEENVVIGTELRKVVHATGLLHRAVYCFVFNTDGKLLLQQRSRRKGIGPLQWDLSVAEHLTPGEAYVQAARRGLQEELGIFVDTDQLIGPLNPARLRKLDIPGKCKDYEFVQSFRVDGWEGQVTLDEHEVAAVRWEAPADVFREAEQDPGRFTPWFLDEMRSLNWFGIEETTRSERFSTRGAVGHGPVLAAR